VKLDDEALEDWREAEGKRLAAEWSAAEEVEKRRRDQEAKAKEGVVSAAEQSELAELEEQLRGLRPQWLSWASHQQRSSPPAGKPETRAAAIDAVVRAQQPRVLARFENGSRSPYLVERKIGAGKIIFAASGLSSSWNTLLTTNATVLFDRMLRGMIEETLPRRNFAARERLTLPLLTDDHDAIVAVLRPQAAAPEPLDIGYIGEEQRGITLTDLYQRGIYRVSGYRAQTVALDSSQTSAVDKPAWHMPLAIGGDAEESNLAPLSRERLDEISATTNIHWVAPGDEISLAGATIRGQNLWWWLAILAVLACLLAEMTILAWPNLRPAEATS
jgi:hypothetical protein